VAREVARLEQAGVLVTDNPAISEVFIFGSWAAARQAWSPAECEVMPH
jgi:hypothetical protein